MSFDSFLTRTLNEKKSNELLRARATVTHVDGVNVAVAGHDGPLISFCSNDYLGLSQHPSLIEAAKKTLAEYGAGSGASHLVSGHSEHHKECEKQLADFTGRDAALLFSTGYMANMGVISALLDRNDAVFQDKLNHASLLDAAMLSRATLVRFRHGDVAHLDQLLTQSHAKKKLIAVDGVFSMDGDVAPLRELSKLAKKHNAWLMVDDAHGFGCMGEQGAGCVNSAGLTQDDVPVLMGTLGKAVGSFGAFVAGPQKLIDSLVQLARPYIYTTALPPSVAAATCASLKIIKNTQSLQRNLEKNIAYFKSHAARYNIALMVSDSAIQPVLIGDEKTVLALSHFLKEKGFWVVAIRPPTVPKGTSRLRITLSAAHTTEHIKMLLKHLGDALRKFERAM